ncbi:polysaccharide deacetylase family protein [Butyrivibrio sp. INlla21]|uniref:polysaccharide deacetylase family protein n=1 Tax=Butyrivibrio sp. INlla21 TaxID=1520811 RepID=UPI0008F27A6E|nr:polysaccharide deacetylase family protein [Butyrivibrio sp. INlla21]SFU94689.1 Peptidoglycan/xylan/chitin deacetylase, PgdA/CDA1 family [Butyrivibrio sp. INlla21]
MDNKKKYIALTFDDGPSDTTTLQVLDKLKKYGVVASFFLIGENMTPERSHIIKEEIAHGCDIQNHSLTHSDMREFNKETILAEIKETSRRIVEYTGKEPTFFRPPYIYVNDLMMDTIPLVFISGYNGLDWDPEVPASERARMIIEGARDGAVILLHDLEGNDATVEALDTIIPDLLREGYEFVTITELFDRAGINYQNAKREVYSYTDQ